MVAYVYFGCISCLPCLPVLAMAVSVSVANAFAFAPAFPPVPHAFRVQQTFSFHENRPSRLYVEQQQQESAADLVASNMVPVTLLAGFLGSGKTCTLQHLLAQHGEDAARTRIGVIVNDMASVNIDSKLLIRNTTTTSTSTSTENVHLVELQNGCACCSLADELFTSIDVLLSAKNNENEGFDALVVELSGVADPMVIKSNWNMAKSQGHPVTKHSYISNVVTLVDATTFGTDWMTWDSVRDRPEWMQGTRSEIFSGDACATVDTPRFVPELLAEQIEAANVVVLNKIDLAGESQTRMASALVESLNEQAQIVEVEYGRVATPNILVPRKESRAVTPEDIRHANNPDGPSKTSAQQKIREEDDEVEEKEVQGGDDIDEMSMEDLKSLMLEIQGEGEENLIPEDATLEEVRDIVWNRVVIAHDEHEASHAASASTSVQQLGITNFVYKSDRPFNTNKLFSLLNQWPVPINDDLSILRPRQGEQQEKVHDYDYDAEGSGSPFAGTLRSKGFCWFAPTKWQGPNNDGFRHDTAMYWSHAGKHFEIVSAGQWWDTVASGNEMQPHFHKDTMDESERIMNKSFVSEEFGDRRQEIVFIGVNIDKEAITKALNSCLVTKAGMVRYRQSVGNCA